MDPPGTRRRRGHSSNRLRGHSRERPPALQQTVAARTRRTPRSARAARGEIRGPTDSFLTSQSSEKLRRAVVLRLKLQRLLQLRDGTSTLAGSQKSDRGVVTEVGVCRIEDQRA